MNAKPLPSQSLLHELLEYNRETGVLVWKTRGIKFFELYKNPIRSMNSWNGKNAERPALSSRTSNGYLHGSVLNQSCLAHRVIWKMETGSDPIDIDHINGDRADNRFVNLRSCDRSENMRNRGISSNNKTGHHGIYRDARSGSWYAQIEVSGVVENLGSYKNLDDAVAARMEAEARLGFHDNHGKRNSYAMALASLSS